MSTACLQQLGLGNAVMGLVPAGAQQYPSKDARPATSPVSRGSGQRSVHEHLVGQWRPTHIYTGVSINLGYPQMDGLQGKIPLKWMILGGTRISGNHHLCQNVLSENLVLPISCKVEGRTCQGTCSCHQSVPRHSKLQDEKNSREDSGTWCDCLRGIIQRFSK